MTFGGALAATAVPTMTINASGLTGNPSSGSATTVQNWVNGSASGFKPYVDGGSAWQIGNISFNGDTTPGTNTTPTGLSVVTPPAVTPATQPANTVAVNHSVTLTSTAYSELGNVSAPWQDSPNGFELDQRRRRPHDHDRRRLHQ